MAASGLSWASGGSLESRFFVDDGLWREAPLLTGQTSFTPLPDVKNILVTGGEGFIASWLVRHLVVKYPDAYNVVCFDKLDYCSSRNNSRMLEGRANFKFFHGELTNPADVLRCLKEHQIDTVFHLAAQSHVDLSFGNSYSFTRNNVFGTHVLLESAVTVKTIKRFYHISTDEVYGEVETDAADLAEHSVLAPTNPYAASKAAAEMYVTAYVRSFRLPVVMIRLNNVYGPHQFPEKIIPKFINLLQRRQALCIHGDGHNTRRYLYAGDAADAFDTILHRGEIGQIYNVDSRDEIANLALAHQLLAAFGIVVAATTTTSSSSSDEEGKGSRGGGWIQHTRDRPFNDRRYAVDGTKLRTLGWTQRVSFADGLAATVEWYGKFGGWWGPIEKILQPFPVVVGGGDEVVEVAGGGGGGDGGTAVVGLRSEFESSSSEPARVGAEDRRTAKLRRGGGIGVGANGSGRGPNGHSGGNPKKRKAGAMMMTMEE